MIRSCSCHNIRSNFQMFCIVLLCTAALADTRVYEITDTDEIIAGLYVETEDPHTFQQLGGPDDEGYYLYLYNPPSNPTKWMIGDGKNMKRIEDSYSAQAVLQEQENPPQNGWTSSETGTIQHFKVLERSSLVYTLKQTETNNGSLTLAGGAICLDQSSDKWIVVAGPTKCKDGEDCTEYLNQLCLRVENDSTEAQKHYKMTEDKETNMTENNKTTMTEKQETSDTESRLISDGR